MHSLLLILCSIALPLDDTPERVAMSMGVASLFVVLLLIVLLIFPLTSLFSWWRNTSSQRRQKKVETKMFVTSLEIIQEEIDLWRDMEAALVKNTSAKHSSKKAQRLRNIRDKLADSVTCYNRLRRQALISLGTNSESRLPKEISINHQ
ncbi:MAG: hypothetical protein WEC84_02710 [Candidatus Andersenbacteria bacterium]